MANNTGTLVTSPVRPQSDADKIPIGFQNEILGGFHNQPNIAGRDAIFPERRASGMLVSVDSETGKIYQLQGGTGNANWVGIFDSTNQQISTLNSQTNNLSGQYNGLAGQVASLTGTVSGLVTSVSGLNVRTTTLETTLSGIASGGINSGVILDRDIQYGLNTLRQNYISSSLADLDPRSLLADTTTVPRTGGAVIATQSGGVLSVPSGGFLFYPADIGRRVIFANGVDTVITGIYNPGGAYLGPAYSGTYWNPTNIIYTDRSQIISGQFRLQAKGLCFASMGDSTGYSSYTDLRNKLYRAYGYGGAFISSASDTTIGDYEFTVKSTGVVDLTNAFDCAPAGLAWSVPSGESVECYMNPKYRANVNDDPSVFDILQEDRLSDWATILVKKKAGAKIKIERKRHEDNDFVLVADNVDVSTGPEDIIRLDYANPLDVCWHYKVTTVEDTGGGGVTLVGVFLENRTTPGFVFVRWDTGGAKITDFNTITTSSLKVLNQVLKFDCVLYQFRDYGGPGSGQVPDLPVILPQVTQKWKDAGARNNWAFIGGYNNDDNTVYWENEAMRTFALANGHIWIDLRAFVGTFQEAWYGGIMTDGTHLGGKGARPMGNAVSQQLGLLDNPWTKDPRNTKAQQGDFDVLRIRGRDVRLALEAAKYGPWENGVKMLSASGYSAWATIPAPGTGGLTVQMWIDIPAANPVSTLTLFGIHPTTSTSNAAKMVTCYIDTAGRLTVVFRNYTNDGTATYRVEGIVTEYGDQRACITVVIDPTKDHPTFYVGTQKANHHGLGSFAAAGTVQKINDPFDIAGTNFNLGISQTHFARAVALWNGVLGETEILKNAERGTLVGTTPPIAYWFASTGSGRYIIDISGNGRHVLLRNSSPASINDSGDGTTTGFAWLKPTTNRSTFVMTANSGMVARQGEDIIVNITAGTLGTITLPANPDPNGPSIRVFGVSAGSWRIAQPANVQIATGAGAVEGRDITTAGTTGYIQAVNKYDTIELKAISTILWVAPAFPAGSTVAIAPVASPASDPVNVVAARAAAWTRGGAKTIGNYGAFGTIPALGTTGFTMQIWKQIPLVNPAALVRLMMNTVGISLSNQPNLLDVTLRTDGRLGVAVRDGANANSRTYLLNNFVTKYAGRFDCITVRFDPTKANPEVWVGNEQADSILGGNLTWSIQDSGGSPPTMAASNFTGTALHVGADTPTYQFALWSGVLTDTEIAANGTAGRVVGTTAPLVYFLFNEGRGRYVYDNSGNNRHLKAVTISNGFNDNSGNGITTGFIWLNPVKLPVFTATVNNQGATLRQGERFETIGNAARISTSLPDIAAKELGAITVFNFGDQGFRITQPSGHRIIISGQGNQTGINGTALGTGGYIQSTDYLTEFQLTPVSVDNVTPLIVWHGKTMAGSVIIGGLPVPTANPTISGNRIVGSTLTGFAASWVETPTSITREWLRAGSPIVGATGTTYLLSSGDAGYIVSLRENGFNSFGSGSATSIETEVVASNLLTIGTESGVTPSLTSMTLAGDQNAFRILPGDLAASEPYLDVDIVQNGGQPFKLRTNRFEGRIVTAPTGSNLALSTPDGRSLKVIPMTVPATLNSTFPVVGTANADKAGPPLWTPTASHFTLPAFNSSFEIGSVGSELPIFISEFDGVNWTPVRWAKLPVSGVMRFQANYKQVAVANYAGTPLSVRGPAGTVISGNSALMHLPFLAPTGTTRNVSDMTGFKSAIAAAVAGDQIVMAPGTYNLDIAIDRTTFAANHGAGSPQRQGGEGIMIRSASGTGTVVIGGTGGTAGNWDLGRSTILSGALPFMMSGVTLNFSGLNAGFSYNGGYVLLEDVIATGPNITGATIKDIMSLGTILSGDMNYRAMALRCRASDSYADVWNVYGIGAENQGNSRVTLIDCQGHRAGNTGDAQVLTTHERMPFLIYGGYYSDGHTYVVQGAANTDRTYLFFTKTAAGTRNANLLWVNSFGSELTDFMAAVQMNPTGYMETTRVIANTGFVANGVFREASANQLYVAGNIITTPTTTYFPNVDTTTQFRHNIITSGTVAVNIGTDSQTGYIDITANTVAKTTTAYNFNPVNLTVGFRGNVASGNTNSVGATVSGGARVNPKGYNTLDPTVSASYGSGSFDVLGTDAAIDANYFPISGGNCYANAVPTGIGVTYVGGSDYQGFVNYYSTGIADRGARSLPRIISGAKLFPDIYM